MMTSEANLEVSERRHNDVAVPVLTLRGEIDVATAPLLREQLHALADRGSHVAVADLSDVTFVDSTTLGVLISGMKRFRSTGGDLRLVVTDPHVAKVFSITGLDDVFAVYQSTRQAVAG
jgi:anti-sigma B factor antagonist